MAKTPLAGDLVRDRVTGLEGIVVARTQHLNMCDRYMVQPQLKKGTSIVTGEEKLPAAYNIDEADLSVIKENAIGATPEQRARWSATSQTSEVTPDNGGPVDVIEHEPA